MRLDLDLQKLLVPNVLGEFRVTSLTSVGLCYLKMGLLNRESVKGHFSKRLYYVAKRFPKSASIVLAEPLRNKRRRPDPSQVINTMWPGRYTGAVSSRNKSVSQFDVHIFGQGPQLRLRMRPLTSGEITMEGSRHLSHKGPSPATI